MGDFIFTKLAKLLGCIIMIGGREIGVMQT
jgi:hypothetical protein